MPYVAPTTITHTTATTHNPGETLPSADYNVIVNDVNQMGTGYNVIVNDIISFRNNSGVVPPSCRVYKTASAAVTSGTAITWDLESFDTDNMHSTSSNTERITINTAGIYLVTFTYTLGFAGTITKEQPTLRKNGGAYTYVMKYGSGVTNTAHTMHTILSLSAADYLDALITFTGGSTFTVDGNTDATSFSAVMLGATS